VKKGYYDAQKSRIRHPAERGMAAGSRQVGEGPVETVRGLNIGCRGFVRGYRKELVCGGIYWHWRWRPAAFTRAGAARMDHLSAPSESSFRSDGSCSLWSTVNPAQEIRRPELGNLSVGAGAEVTVLRLKAGDFRFLDAHNLRYSGTQKLECELTVRNGRVVWDLNGRAGVDWQKAVPRRPNIKQP
jgi:hypothetical protein